MHMTSLQLEQTHVVTLSIPGVDGIALVYDPHLLNVDPQRIQAATTILAHWLKHQRTQIGPRQVRDALRRFTSPWLLGETELAPMLFARMKTSTARGTALQSMLQDAIGRLDPGRDAPRDHYRQYFILRRLYLERRIPQQISRELGLSVRQYQRYLSDALVALSQILACDLEGRA